MSGDEGVVAIAEPQSALGGGARVSGADDRVVDVAEVHGAAEKAWSVEGPLAASLERKAELVCDTM
jgi:hypothetical protein